MNIMHIRLFLFEASKDWLFNVSRYKAHQAGIHGKRGVGKGSGRARYE